MSDDFDKNDDMPWLDDDDDETPSEDASSDEDFSFDWDDVDDDDQAEDRPDLGFTGELSWQGGDTDDDEDAEPTDDDVPDLDWETTDKEGGPGNTSELGFTGMLSWRQGESADEEDELREGELDGFDLSTDDLDAAAEEGDVDFGFTGDDDSRTGELDDDYDLSTSQLDMGEDEDVDFGFTGEDDSRTGELDDDYDLSTSQLDMDEDEDVDFGFTGDDDSRTGELDDDYDLSTSQLDMGQDEDVDFGFTPEDEDTRTGDLEGFDLSTADLDAAAEEGDVDFGFTGEQPPPDDDTPEDDETDWSFLDEVDDEDVADFEFDEDSETPDADAFLASLLDEDAEDEPEIDTSDLMPDDDLFAGLSDGEEVDDAEQADQDALDDAAVLDAWGDEDDADIPAQPEPPADDSATADDIFAEWDDLDDEDDADLDAATADRPSQPAYQDLDDLLAGYADDETELPESDDLDAPDPDAVFAEDDADADDPFAEPDTPAPEEVDSQPDQPDFLRDVSVGDEQSSAAAYVRQLENRPEEELDEKLYQLRQRGRGLQRQPDADPDMDAILPGVGDTLNEPDMRYEQEPLSADVEMTDDDARETDVLRNLVASEALQPKRGVSDDPLDELDEFADADDEQPTKKQRPRAQRTFPLGRLLAAVLLIAAVILPFFVDFGFGGEDGPPAAFVEGGDAAAVFEYLGTLAPRDIVLFSVDYSPTHAAELDPIFQTTVRHTLARGAFPVFVGRNPVGVSRVEDLMAEIASDETFTDAVGGEPTFNQDYFVVGYLPGDNAALRELVASPGDVLANNVRGGQTGLDSLNSLDELARIVLLAGTPENVRDWSEQVAPQTTTPLVAGVGAVSEDLSRQYLNAPDGLEGLLVSIEDAAVYNQLLGDQVLPDASTLGSLPTATYTPSITPVISLTPSSTPTLTPIGFQATDTPPDFTPSPPPPDFTPYSVYGVGTFVTAGGGALNVRDEPSINGGLVGVLSPGDFAPVLAEVENDAGEPWTQVLLPEGERGWVASNLLRAANETEAATATADFQPPAATSVAEQPTDTPTEPPTATATATSTPTATATATEPPTETATPTVGSMVQGGDNTETVPGVESMLDEDGNVLPGLETMVDESGNLRPGVESMLDEDGGLIPEAQATVDAAVAQATENAATEEATDAPTQTAEPTATGEPTDTPAPTSTELPTDTPSPSPTPEVLEAGTTVQTSPRTAINVRNGPSTDAERITALRPSTLLQVIGSDESGQWVEVALPDGQTGFIFRELLTVRPEVDAPTLAPSVTPSEPPTEPPTSTPTVTPIPLDAEGLVAVISGSVPVNVRTGPSRAFQPIRPLQPGDVVNLIAPSEDERWLEVQLPDGETGFIIATAAEVVLGETYFEQATATAEAGGQAQLPATDAPDAPTSAPAAEEGTPGRQSLPDGSTVSPRGFEGVNVRGEPARFAPVVGVIPAQSTAPALLRSADGAWIQVELENDTLGWVAASVVTLEIPADAETDADESNETAYRYTPRRYRRPAREYRLAPRRQTDTEGLGVIIASGAANVRSGPGLSFEVVGVAQPEATVDVLSLTDEGGGWAQIRLPNGVEGYISQSLVDIQLMPMATDTNQPDDTIQPTATATDRPNTPNGLDQDGLARVTATGTVNVREEASINAAVVGLVDPGEEVPLLALPESDNGTTWAQIQLSDGTTGFISASLLEVLIPPAEPGEQPPTPTATAANTDTPTATPTITATPRTTPTRTPSNNVQATIDALTAQAPPTADAPELQTEGEGVGTILATRPVNVYLEPDDTSDVIGSAQPAATIPVRGLAAAPSGETWVLVRLPEDDTIGYINASNMTVTRFPAPELSAAAAAQVTAPTTEASEVTDEATATERATSTRRATDTPTQTATDEATATPTVTPTDAATSTPTLTPTPTRPAGVMQVGPFSVERREFDAGLERRALAVRAGLVVAAVIIGLGAAGNALSARRRK